MRRLLFILALLFTPLSLMAQQGNTVIILFPGVPTGTCSFNMVSVDNATGDFYDCDSTGNWNLVGPVAGGASAWDALTVPTASNLSLDMSTFFTDFTWTGNTGASTMFDLRDATGNTGTGYVFSTATIGTSAARAFRATDGGTANGVELNTSAVFQAIGTGSILGTDLAANAIDALADFNPTLCAASQILERQAAIWACIATPAGGTLDLLDGSTHQDTTAGTVVRGDLITGQTATPEWTRLALGGANDIFSSDGTDAAWEAATGTASPVRANNPLFPVQVRFTAIAAPAFSAGQLFYDSGDEALGFHNNESDVTLQIGQEMWIRVRNESGATISNGEVVYIDGLASGLPRIALARADVSATAEAVGLATHDIETASTGFVTAYGVVRDFDTSSFTLADRVYLSASVAGALTSTAPSDPNFVVPIGIITEVNATTGDAFVTLSAPLPIGGAGILVSSNTISTLSSEETFLVSGALSCGANTAGKMQTHTTPLQYCDNAGTPLLRLAAYAASDGDALAGDTATSFFDAGELEPARGGTGQDSSGSTGVPEVAAGTWSFAANIADLASSTSAEFFGVISNETGGTLVVGSDSPVFTTLITFPQEAQWNEAAGDPACVAGEFWIAANSSTNLFRKCQNGATTDLDTSGAVRWDELSDPTAAVTMNSNANAELTSFLYTSALGATDVAFTIEQLTGNPVAGSIMLEVKGADTDVQLVSFGTGANTIDVSQAGAMTAAGTATITATDLAANALDALTEIDPTLCAASQILERGGSVWACIATPAGGTTRWDELIDPTAAINLNSNDNAELFQMNFTSALGATDVAVQIEQLTGNPVAGSILLELVAADTDILLLSAGAGANTIDITQAGAMTAEGTATIVATSGDSADSFFSSGTIEVARGGTNLSSGTDGGILGYTATGTLASSALLTASALVLGGGTGATPSTPVGLGTTTTVLHGNAGGAPTFGAVVLTADVSGLLPNANGGTGIDTSGSTGISRVDSGTWSVSELSGDVATSGSNATLIQAGVVASAELATANKTFPCNITLFDDTGLSDTDDIDSVGNCSRPGRAITITAVIAETDAGSPIINLQRDDGSPANVLSSNCTATTGGTTCSIDLAEDNFAATDKMDFVMVSGASGSNRVSILIQYTVD